MEFFQQSSSGVSLHPDTPEAQAELERIEELGQEVLAECRSALMLRFRFLDLALWRMPLKAEPAVIPLATNGKTLAFDPIRTVLRFRMAPNEAMRDMLHTVLHCIFRQPFDDSKDNPDAWQLACDVSVESIALEMCEDRFHSELDEVRKRALKILQDSLGTLSPPKLYRAFKKVMEGEGEVPLETASAAQMANSPAVIGEAIEDAAFADLMAEIPDDYEYNYANLMNQAVSGLEEHGYLLVSDLFVIQQLFERDSHHKWACNRIDDGYGGDGALEKRHMPSKSEPTPDIDSEASDGSSASEDQEEQNSGLTDTSIEEDIQLNGEDDETVNDRAIEEIEALLNDEERKEAEEDWEEIARQIEMELEANSMMWSEEAGTLRQLLPVSNRPKCDYSDFLRRFAVVSEDIKVNEDEFDYIFYTYGLQEYGNRPLIEPLEYQETNRVRDFVIAIDTSESCSGELVRAFVDRTFQILKDAETFSSHVNIHIIQCDSKVQSDIKIESKQDLKFYLDSFECRGFGGTDFRPVFNYVDELIEAGEFRDLCGLIYFTDGLGTYPAKMPDYKTAFVFMGDSFVYPNVPPWAMKVVLDEDEIRTL